MTRIQKKNRRGFTLIELMVVVAILAILGVIVMAVGSNVKQKAQISKTKQTLINLQGILEEYERDTGGALTATNDGTGYDTTDYISKFMAYPSTKEKVQKYVTTIGGSTMVIFDDFGKQNGNRIYFVNDGTHRGFISNGPSGNPSATADLIKSWEAQ